MRPFSASFGYSFIFFDLYMKKLQMKYVILLGAVFALSAVSAQQQAPGGRDAFLRQQAYAEMQRVSGQIDALQNSVDDLRHRVQKLESGSNTRAMQAEIDALKATCAELRRQIASQREEISRDLGERLVKIQQKMTPPPPPPKESKKVVVAGPTATYTVQNGDSLFLIAKAFNTSVRKLREMNGLKNDALKVGQKLTVPAN